MKKRFIILFIVLAITLVVILGILYTKNHNIISESPIIEYSNLVKNDNEVNIQNISEEKNEYEIKNNGGNFVKIGDSIYFWKLKKESRKEIGLDASYSEVSNMKNDLICINSLGEQNVILNDFGIGKIYISNNKLFLSSHTGLEKGITFSVNLDGTNKKVYENIEEIISGNNNYIIYKSNSKVYTMNTKNDECTEIFNIGEYEFLKFYNNTIYYYKTPKYGDTTITLKSMNTEGKQNKVIKEISVEGIEIKNDYSIVDIMQFDIDENNFYISYGYIDGTTQTVQDSEICIFRKENPQEQFVLEGYSKFDFYQENENKYIVSVSDIDSEKSITANVNTFEKLEKDIPKNIFKDDIILSEVFKQNQSIVSDELLAASKYFDKIDGYAYYLLDISVPFLEENVEWKSSYKQEKSYCIKQNLENNEYEVLYEF